MNIRVRCSLLFVVLLFATFAGAQSVLVETESFENYGGWVLDQQFMDQMGSSYLLAHGLGVVVEDATTNVEFPSTGEYKVWVRTKDWVGLWKQPDTEPIKRAVGKPGKFKVVVDGNELDTVFGVEGAQWFWQDGGTVEIDKLIMTVKLHDLTGFEGRCDAILFTKDMSLDPPNSDPAMKQWRRGLLGLPDKAVEAGEYDLVVVGAGMGGVCATLKGARLGLKVALIQDRYVIGGNNSSEVRVWLNGNTNYDPYPRIGDMVAEFEPAGRAHYGPSNTAELYEDQRREDLLAAEENVTLFFGYRANGVETDDEKITAVIAQNIKTNVTLRFKGKYFADCTGDGCIGFLAGADYDMTLDGHMGRCNLWNVIDTGASAPFPTCSWALNLANTSFPSGINQLGGWYWESGFYHDPFEKSEYIRDWNFRAMYGAWDKLKNLQGKYPTYKLNWAAHISGKRESRRLLGDIILEESDFVNGVKYPDGCVPCSWSIDLHLPDPAYNQGYDGDGFISKAYYTNYTKPYWVPYRCLYSRNVNNLFMAGRDISVTHEALGAVRVMRTGGMMGEIVGMAASLCKKYDTSPRGVYIDHLGELINLMKKDILRGWLERIGPSLALDADVSVRSNHDAVKYPKDNINDGKWDVNDSDLRWLSNKSVMPDYIEFEWDKTQTISAARIISGWNSGSGATDPIIDFKFQSYDAGNWHDIEGSQVTGNRRVEWVGKFTPVQTENIRLVITQTPGDISRIWEVELFHPAADVNSDGIVNFGDVAELGFEWLAKGADMRSDLDWDEAVDMKDFSIISGFWNWP